MHLYATLCDLIGQEVWPPEACACEYKWRHYHEILFKKARVLTAGVRAFKFSDHYS